MGRPGRRRWRSACSSSPSHSGRRVFSGDRIIDLADAGLSAGFDRGRGDRVLCRAYGEQRLRFFAGYTILQFIVLATAWNILGGYTGYVNFGSAAFFAMGAYST